MQNVTRNKGLRRPAACVQMCVYVSVCVCLFEWQASDHSCQHRSKVLENNYSCCASYSRFAGLTGPSARPLRVITLSSFILWHCLRKHDSARLKTYIVCQRKLYH